MGEENNKNKLFLTQNNLGSITEYYGTDCTGKLLEVTISLSNNTTERLVSYKDLPRDVFCTLFRMSSCKKNRDE